MSAQQWIVVICLCITVVSNLVALIYAIRTLLVANAIKRDSKRAPDAMGSAA